MKIEDMQIEDKWRRFRLPGDVHMYTRIGELELVGDWVYAAHEAPDNHQYRHNLQTGVFEERSDIPGEPLKPVSAGAVPPAIRTMMEAGRELLTLGFWRTHGIRYGIWVEDDQVVLAKPSRGNPDAPGAAVLHRTLQEQCALCGCPPHDLPVDQ